MFGLPVPAQDPVNKQNAIHLKLEKKQELKKQCDDVYFFLVGNYQFIRASFKPEFHDWATTVARRAKQAGMGQPAYLKDFIDLHKEIAEFSAGLKFIFIQRLKNQSNDEQDKLLEQHPHLFHTNERVQDFYAAINEINTIARKTKISHFVDHIMNKKIVTGIHHTLDRLKKVAALWNHDNLPPEKEETRKPISFTEFCLARKSPKKSEDANNKENVPPVNTATASTVYTKQ